MGQGKGVIYKSLRREVMQHTLTYYDIHYTKPVSYKITCKVKVTLGSVSINIEPKIKNHILISNNYFLLQRQIHLIEIESE